MIIYSEIKVGDSLKIVGSGAPGYAPNGEIVTVTEINENSVGVKNRHGEIANFFNSCGAERLEKI